MVAFLSPRRLRSHLSRGLQWARGALGQTGCGNGVLRVARAAAAVAHGFKGEKISLRASALTYITMLSLVPALAVAFAVVRALGQESLRQRVHDFVFATLAPGTREEIGAYLDQFLARASTGAMGGVGGLFLLVSAVTLLSNVEQSLNAIWGVTRPRPLLQRVLVYWAILTLGPVALGLSIAAGTAAQTFASEALLVPRPLLSIVPLASTVLLLSFLYVVAPNARVRWRPALAGGAVAGVAWELAKHGYATYAARSIQYSAIYGSLGAIPLFLLWVFVSWLLLLFGARLAYAVQTSAVRQAAAGLEDRRGREVLCAGVAVSAARAFGGGTAPTPSSIARELEIEPSAVLEAVRILKEEGLLAEGKEGAVLPARAPGLISLADIARAARGGLFDHAAAPPEASQARKLWELFESADAQARARLEEVTLADLARAGPEEPRAGSPESHGEPRGPI